MSKKNYSILAFGNQENRNMIFISQKNKGGGMFYQIKTGKIINLSKKKKIKNVIEESITGNITILTEEKVEKDDKESKKNGRK